MSRLSGCSRHGCPECRQHQVHVGVHRFLYHLLDQPAIGIGVRQRSTCRRGLDRVDREWFPFAQSLSSQLNWQKKRARLIQAQGECQQSVPS